MGINAALDPLLSELAKRASMDMTRATANSS
jgi:hypothetical protein